MYIRCVFMWPQAFAEALSFFSKELIPLNNNSTKSRSSSTTSICIRSRSILGQNYGQELGYGTYFPLLEVMRHKTYFESTKNMGKSSAWHQMKYPSPKPKFGLIYAVVARVIYSFPRTQNSYLLHQGNRYQC